MTTSPPPHATERRGTPDVATFWLDANGAVLDASPQAAVLLGRPISALLGIRSLSLIHPVDRPTSRAVTGQVALLPGAWCSLRLRVERGDGSFMACRCRFENRFEDHEIRAVMVTVEPSATLALRSNGTAYPLADDTKLVSPNPLVSLLDADQVGILVADSNGVRFIGPSMAELLRWDLDELAIRYADLFHPDDQDALVEYLAILGNGGKSIAQADLRLARGDGTWGLFRLSTIDLSDDPDYGMHLTVVSPSGEDPVVDSGDRNRERLLSAMNLAADPVIMVTPARKIRFASPAAGALLECPVAAVISRKLVELVAPEHVAALDRWLDDPGSDQELRVEFLLPDAEKRWVSIRPLFSQDAVETNERVLVLHDIHAQTLAEQALQARELRFEALIRNAPGCVLVIDAHDRVRDASPSVERTLGLRADLVIGMDLWSRAHPDDRAALAAASSAARTSNAPVVCRGRINVSDGSYRWFEATQQVHDDASLDGIVVNLLDRTDAVLADLALHESERRYKSLVQHSFEITVILDEDLVIGWLSPSVHDLLGWNSDDLTGTSAIDFIHPDDLGAALANLDAALAQVTPRPFTTIRVSDARMGWRWVAASVADRRDDPDIGGLIVNLRDATDQVADKHALESSENRYRTLVQNSTDVVQIMSASAKVLWVSPAVENVLGYTPTELVSEPTGALAGLEGREELVKSFLDVLRAPGTTSRCVSRAKHADGSWRWIDVVLVNHLDEPDIHGVVATYRDITERIEADQARRTSEERFRSLAESSPLGIFQLDLDQHCTYVNDRWCEITGLDVIESAGTGWRTPILRGGNWLGQDDADIDHYFEPGPGLQLVRSDGESRWCAVHFAPLTDDIGDRIGSVGTIDDVTSTVDARHEARRLSTILQATPDLVMLFVPEGTLVYMNAAACKFFDIPDDVNVRGTPVADFLPAENIELWHSQILPTIEIGDPWQGETTVRNRVGDIIPISAVVIAHLNAVDGIEMVSITARDMSDRKALEARLQHQATHDPLTGLPNRTLLMDRLEMAMMRTHRNPGVLGVLFLDLDHFKVVNDSLGHGTGDELLTILAGRLSDQVRPGDTVARFGGDEFVIVCEGLEDAIEAEQIAERIAVAMAEPAWIGDSEVFVTASVGIAIVDRLHNDPDQVLRDADAAMYQAKARGRARYELFDPRFRTRALDRLEVENALRRALARNELVVHYQPVFDLRTNEIVGVEALLRWEHPERALLRCGGEPVRSSDLQPDVGRGDHRDPGRDRHGPRSSHPGDHRKHPDGRRRPIERHVGQAQATRHPTGDRRLRDGLFVVRVPAEVPGGRPQGGPFVRVGTRC